MRNDLLKEERKQVAMEALKELRKARRESQSKFWKRFGVTQSRGSRFEQGLKLPVSVAILVKLYFDGKISDGDLLRARRSASVFKRISFFNRMNSN